MNVVAVIAAATQVYKTYSATSVRSFSAWSDLEMPHSYCCCSDQSLQNMLRYLCTVILYMERLRDVQRSCGVRYYQTPVPQGRAGKDIQQHTMHHAGYHDQGSYGLGCTWAGSGTTAPTART